MSVSARTIGTAAYGMPRYVFRQDVEKLRPLAQLSVTPVEALGERPHGFECTLLELGDNSCRFPLGDPREQDFRFCGADMWAGEPDASYCEHHARLSLLKYRR